MKRAMTRSSIGAILAAIWICAASATAQDATPRIPESKISALEESLAAQEETTSQARKRLAIRRIVREGDSLLKEHPAAANRYQVLGILFSAQRELL